MLPDNSFLDIILSLILIYAILSILVSILIEWWQHKTKARARFLKETIHQLLNDKRNVDFGSLFYSHYLIEGMQFQRKKRPPAYISSSMFAETLIDIIAGMHKNSQSVILREPVDEAGKQYDLGNIIAPDIMTQFDEGLKALHPSPLSETIRSFRQKSNGPDELKKHLARWYDDYMDRVSGWFKTDQRRTFVVMGFVVAILLNADSFFILKMVSLDSKLRSGLVTYAEGVATQYHQLSDTARQNAHQLTIMLHSVPIDSTLSNKHTGSLSTEELQKNLLFQDSVSRVSLQRADSVLGIAASLNVPIGWSTDTAPLSWFKSKKDKKLNHHRKQRPHKKREDKISKNHRQASNPGVMAYMAERNKLTFWGVINYLGGIIVTGIMLSFGAPFWFDTLVKLINIRRAGVKPEASNVTK